MPENPAPSTRCSAQQPRRQTACSSLALTAAGVVPALLPQLRTDAGRQLLNNLAMQALREESGG